ncbi:hypothetical protein TNCV_704111 [Trichonephila clavipes]|nr:hypothetical protein TNCV_704111 [Trichonephila clavipes]
MVTRKVSQDHHRASTSAQDHYLTLSARRHRRTTSPHLVRDLAAVSRRRISRKTVYSCLAEIVLYTRRQVLCVPSTTSNRKNSIFLELRTSVMDTIRMGVCVFFLLMSRDSSDKVILVVSSPGEKVELTFIPPTLIKIDIFRGKGILVWGDIMLGSRTPLYVFVVLSTYNAVG